MRIMLRLIWKQNKGERYGGRRETPVIQKRKLKPETKRTPSSGYPK
jgi:hypothetical protein